MTQRGLTLLEVLLAVVLLALVVVACLPMLRPPAVRQTRVPSATLDRIAAAGSLVPPNAVADEFDAQVGEHTAGRWRVVVGDSGYGIAWIADRDEGTPP